MQIDIYLTVCVAFFAFTEGDFWIGKSDMS